MSDTEPARTIAIIDDHAMVADALSLALAQAPDFEPVGVAHTIADGITMVARTRPDVVLTDLRLPEGDLIEQLPALRQAHVGAKILVITGWPDEASFLRAIAAGVQGFLDKLQPLDELTAAIRRSLRGELVVAPRFQATMQRRMTGRTVSSDELSRRELEVLELLARGVTTSEIARSLYLSVNTVRNHISRALAKLGAHSRLEAVHVAVNRGLIGRSFE